MRTLDFTRVWSYFAPNYQYSVRDTMQGGLHIGYVARMEGSRVWYASNKTWTGGGDFRQTFRTRADAARALRFVAEDPSLIEHYGGYVPAKSA